MLTLYPDSLDSIYQPRQMERISFYCQKAETKQSFSDRAHGTRLTAHTQEHPADPGYVCNHNEFTTKLNCIDIFLNSEGLHDRWGDVTLFTQSKTQKLFYHWKEKQSVTYIGSVEGYANEHATTIDSQRFKMENCKACLYCLPCQSEGSLHASVSSYCMCIRRQLKSSYECSAPCDITRGLASGCELAESWFGSKTKCGRPVTGYITTLALQCIIQYIEQRMHQGFFRRLESRRTLSDDWTPHVNKHVNLLSVLRLPKITRQLAYRE